MMHSNTINMDFESNIVLLKLSFTNLIHLTLKLTLGILNDFKKAFDAIDHNMYK